MRPSPFSPQVTPLFLACIFKAWNSALLLLSKGADPNKAARLCDDDLETATPLLFAAGHGNTDVCKTLLASGARQDTGLGNFFFYLPSGNGPPLAATH